jgi:transcriptional regulator with XRE-family HTH domain
VAVLNYEVVASEFLRALRGSRSQTAFARRLGYRSNVVHSWEVGRAFPTAAKTLWAATRIGLDVPGALATLYRKKPGWLGRTDITTPDGVAEFLRDLQGNLAIGDLASKVGRSRFATARWLHGQSEPRLPDFFRLLDALTLRLIDFISVVVEPQLVPSIKEAYLELEQARKATYQKPWSQAVLRVLEMQAYADLPAHQPGWVAAKLDIPKDEEDVALELLVITGQAELRDGKYHLASDPKVIDTRRDPKAAHALRAFWADVARQRMDEPGDALFSHSLFGVSEKDYQRIRELQKAYYQEIRAIVAASQPVERVALLNLQLLPLTD